MNRRTWMGGAGALGLGGCASAHGRTAAGYGEVVPGAQTWSESLMLLHFDERAENGFSVRVSRYPDMNATWVWCHILRQGRIFAFTERRLPCAAERNAGEAVSARYDAPEAGVLMTRNGAVQDMSEIALDVGLRAHGTMQGVDGPGDTPIVLSARFRPQWLKRNPPPGRSEWTGRVDARLVVGGQAVELAGIAKAHEQTQTDPRFTDPFTYGILWSGSASFVAVSSPARRYGDWEIERRSAAVEEMRVAPPSAHRRFLIRLSGGGEIDGVAHSVASYQVPVFGRFWSGNVVRALLGGHNMVGMLNDWRPDEQEFSLYS